MTPPTPRASRTKPAGARTSPVSVPPTGIAAQAVELARREVAVEFAGREALVVVVPFTLAACLLAGLAFGPAPDVLRATAPGLPWLLVLVGALPLTRSVAAAERDEGCWDLLRGLVAPTALLAGKTLALWLWLLATWTVALLLALALFTATVGWAGIVAGPLGTLGIAATVVVFGTVIGGAERRGGLLGVLLLPAGLPALVAGSQAATPLVDAAPWLLLLVVYDTVALVAAWAAYPVLLEE